MMKRQYVLAGLIGGGIGISLSLLTLIALLVWVERDAQR